MRKVIILASIFLTVFVSACKDELEPFGETNEKYVLNCVIRSDTNYQVLTLTKSYKATSFDPYSNTIDPSIKGAIVRLWEGNDKVAFFTDTTIARDPSSLYKTPFSFYHVRGIQPEPNSALEIEVILPSGKKLKSTGIAPPRPVFQKLDHSAEGDTLVPPKDKNYIVTLWGNQIAPRGTVFLPKAYIVYKVPENGVEVRKEKLIPKGYFTYGGQEYPDYPSMSNNPRLTIDMKIIDRCMAEISEGDPDKGKYKIYALIVDVISLDNNLSAYYNATNKNKDPYAVKLYETDYSNISGGFGVFGISYFARTAIDISLEYVKSFRYEHGYKVK